LRNHLHAAVRQITRAPGDIQSLRLEPGAVTKEHALNPAKN
jgi:hypothetical protein